MINFFFIGNDMLLFIFIIYYTKQTLNHGSIQFNSILLILLQKKKRMIFNIYKTVKKNLRFFIFN